MSVSLLILYCMCECATICMQDMHVWLTFLSSSIPVLGKYCIDQLQANIGEHKGYFRCHNHSLPFTHKNLEYLYSIVPRKSIQSSTAIFVCLNKMCYSLSLSMVLHIYHFMVINVVLYRMHETRPYMGFHSKNHGCTKSNIVPFYFQTSRLVYRCICISNIVLYGEMGLKG